MANQPNKGLRRLIKAAGYSWAGLKAAWQHEEAFRLEILLCLVLIPAALWLGENSAERALMVASLVLVVIVELINSALEAVVDRIGPERHELSGRVKDVGSAAVLVALFNVLIIWIILLF